jgi:hypothetical protein
MPQSLRSGAYPGYVKYPYIPTRSRDSRPRLARLRLGNEITHGYRLQPSLTTNGTATILMSTIGLQPPLTCIRLAVFYSFSQGRLVSGPMKPEAKRFRIICSCSPQLSKRHVEIFDFF